MNVFHYCLLTRCRKTHPSMVMLVAVLAFASCASPPENRAATDASLREPTVLSGELLYEVIVGEI